MARILVLILVVAAVIWWLRAQRKPRNGVSETPRTPVQKLSPQTMVACHYCGTHLPETDALWHENQWYCSANHRDAGTP